MPKNKQYKNPVILNMTGDEFKRIIENQDKDDQVASLLELLNLFRGIGDDGTLPQYIQRVAEETKAQNAIYEEEAEKLYINGAKPEPKEGGNERGQS
jgi:hypothetical protein